MAIQNYFTKFKWMLYLAGFLWLVYFISCIFPLNSFGIIPRSISGLPGILFAPFLHADIPHLSANSVSLIMLGFILAATEEKGFAGILITVALLGGLGTWIIGRTGTVHIGASGVIYGILGYLLARGIFRKEIKSLLVSVAVFFLYGGMIFGVLPTVPSMSWESHLCGFIAGVITASTPAARKKR